MRKSSLYTTRSVNIDVFRTMLLLDSRMRENGKNTFLLIQVTNREDLSMMHFSFESSIRYNT